MNILFSLYTNNTESAKTYIMVMDSLTKLGHKIVVLSKISKYIELIPKECEIQNDIKNLNTNDFDLILTSTSNNVGVLKKIFRSTGIPIIGLIDSSDYALKKIAGHNKMDKLILLNPPLDYPNVLLQPAFNLQWRIPVIFPSTSIDYSLGDPKSPRMVVAIEGGTGLSSPVFQLVSLMNKLSNLKTTLVTENKGMQKILNSNIRIVSREKTDLIQIVAESDIVVGSGRLAEQAVAMDKPVIIVGERGYDGLLTEDIFELQYQNQFQGRVGGTPGEFIPEKLLMENIFDLLEWGNDRINAITRANRKLLQKKEEDQKAALNQLLHKIEKQYRQIKNKLLETRLKLADCWRLQLITNDKYLLTNSVTGKFHSHFETEEASIIELFREGCQVKEALNESGYSEEPGLFTNFIRNLIDENILMIDANS